MFKSFLSFLFTTAVILVVTGCGPNREAQLEGTWKFDSVDLGTAASNPGAAAAIKQIKDSNPTIEFKPDKHFVVSGGKGTEGDWTLKDSTVSLTMTTVQGKSVADLKKQLDEIKAKYPKMAESISKMDPTIPQTATLSEDGKKLSIKSAATGGQTVFTKG